ncbi:hypothetical protein ACGFX4_01695 [Kitasatospora sp. NPDC048365]|uniref:hypothetical protein n=1 Tax=Kitasatospora sp. NPDC048365 TaxID=3364050 RepID=UPI0037222572
MIEYELIQHRHQELLALAAQDRLAREAVAGRPAARQHEGLLHRVARSLHLTAPAARLG